MAVAVRTPTSSWWALHARPQKRLKDELNGNSDHFLALTAARVYDARAAGCSTSRRWSCSTAARSCRSRRCAVGAAAAWSKLLALAPEPAKP